MAYSYDEGGTFRSTPPLGGKQKGRKPSPGQRDRLKKKKPVDEGEIQSPGDQLPIMALPQPGKVPGLKGGGSWIAGAIKKPGALHEDLGVPKGEKIPESKLKAAAGKSGKVGQRARLAETLKGFKTGGMVPFAKEGSAAEEAGESKAEAKAEGDMPRKRSTKGLFPFKKSPK